MVLDTPHRSTITEDNAKLQDQWSFCDFKSKGQGPVGIPLWTGEHARRLRAYTIYDAYYRNSARNWMSDDLDEDEVEDRREYGDPWVVTESILSSLLGNDVRITVTGAVNEEPDEGQQQTELDALKQLQKDAEKWAKKEKFKLKLKESERNAVKLGDSIYVMGWNDEKSRVVVHVWDPGFYFPDLDARSSEEEFAERVYIAYEYEVLNKDSHEMEHFIRIMMWELHDIGNGVPDPKVPWAKGTAKQNCWYSDRTFIMDDFEGTIESFLGKNALMTDEKWLNIDFIPMLHVPTTYNSGHYGVSCLAPVMQLFDDLVNNDTDTQRSGALVASPILGIGNAQVPKDDQGNIKSYGPGTLYETGDGKLDMIDTSRSLDALLKYDENLMGKMSRNSRVPKTLLGDVDPSKVPSGVVLTLSYAPHTSMIREMREIRDDKYSLFMNFWFRFNWKFGTLDWKFDEPEIKVVMGSYLPADKQEVSGIITNMMNSHAMSMETAVSLLVEAGYPIDSVTEEVRRIIQQDWKTADEMFTATGDMQAVRDRMGLTGSGPQLQPPPNTGGGNQPPGPGNTGPPPPPTSGNLGP